MTALDRTTIATAWAPAKVNLYLHVGAPGSDGMHPVDSLVMFADTRAADRVTARLYPKLVLNIEGSLTKAMKGPGPNLVIQAALALRESAGNTGLAAEITLFKELPVAGGVGGGSADAAATLHVLNSLWSISFGEGALEAVALPLGSDVPACVRSRPVWMRGRGERLVDAHAPSVPVVLVNPGLTLETRRVFERFDRIAAHAPFIEAQPPNTLNPKTFAKELSRRRNDLFGAAQELCPEIGKVVELIERQPGCLLARMSGSGPTCFGVFDSDYAAEAAAREIGDRRRRYWVRATTLRGAGGEPL
jgi:4-diphosphocytidyl-2-C-methyl-D-erythritol kinase